MNAGDGARPVAGIPVALGRAAPRFEQEVGRDAKAARQSSPEPDVRHGDTFVVFARGEATRVEPDPPRQHFARQPEVLANRTERALAALQCMFDHEPCFMLSHDVAPSSKSLIGFRESRSRTE
jgi:hypothetical protein